MSTDVQPPPGQPGSNSPGEPAGNRGFGQGPDAGLYFIGVIAILAFISMIAVLFWVASRENSAPVAALPTSSPLAGTEGVVLLPIVSGKSTAEIQVDLTSQAENPAVPTQVPPTMAPAPTDSIVTQTSEPTSAAALFQSPIPTTARNSNRTPSGTATLGATATQTITPTSIKTSQTPTPTIPEDTTALFIRNDQGCVDTGNGDLYIFGEIVNNNPVPVDILNWDVKIYDNGREIQTDDVFLDIPNNYAVFANSSIPFVLLTSLDRYTFTDYDISLDYAPGPHNPRNDLSIVEYSTTQSSGYTEVIGKWSHTDVANPPDIVWIIATTRDSLGRLSNLQYQHYTNASVVDPRLPSGQHSFRQLYLEDNPCGGGTISVSILGE
jgi:hypothetical protein